MALYKIGVTYINEAPYPIYLLQGNAARDAENAPVNGKPHSRVSVAVKRNEQGETLFVTVNGWRDHADDVLRVRKGDSILCVGPLKDRTYNDKLYYDLDVEFICMSGAGIAGAYSPTYEASAPSAALTDLSDEDEDGDLPF